MFIKFTLFQIIIILSEQLITHHFNFFTNIINYKNTFMSTHQTYIIKTKLYIYCSLSLIFRLMNNYTTERPSTNNIKA